MTARTTRAETQAPDDRVAWSRPMIAGLAGIVILGFLVRMVLWPQAGIAGDIDDFVLWVHGIALGGFSHAYDQRLSFPAVMAWIWGLLAAVQPAFRTATDSADPAIRALMKVPASLCDVGIALGVLWWWRDRPRLALTASAAVLFWPLTWYDSALLAQYESVYVLPALLAVLAIRANRVDLAAALVAVALMTKPQALPLAIPFAAWYLSACSWRRSLRALLIVAGVTFALWLPFLPANGPVNYLHNLSSYQNDTFSFLSLRAWNPWWIAQLALDNGNFVSDQTRILGPISYRWIGLGLTAAIAVVVFVGIVRRPTPERLAMGLAAIALGTFVGLTTMHERYAYPAFVFLILCWPRREVVAAWGLLAVALALDLFYSLPPGSIDPPAGLLVSTLGSVGIVAVAIAAIRWTWRLEPDRPPAETTTT